MPDREKVIHGLECCTGLGCHHGCEYLNSGCTELLKKDALALLKKQQHTIWELNEINEYLDDVKKDQEHQIDVLKEQFDKDIIVRCKDCKHARRMCQPWNDLVCEKNGQANKPDWFCADGERR